MNRTTQPQSSRPREDKTGQSAPEAGRKPKKGEQPLSETETGHPKAGGLAGQGGMTDAD